MRHVSILTAAASFVLVIAACASEGEPIPAGNQEEQKPAATPLPEADAAPPPAKKCAPSCATDDDCANSCPTPTTGRACCDVASGMCFSHNQATCPAPTNSSSSGGY